MKYVAPYAVENDFSIYVSLNKAKMGGPTTARREGPRRGGWGEVLGEGVNPDQLRCLGNTIQFIE